MFQPRNAGRVRKAQLESFGALPLDVFEDICTHLDLERIYYLSLVNKQLHAFLTTSKSKPLWKAARKTSGLPELKANDFCDLQYAQLMFGLGCMFCGVIASKNDKGDLVDYKLRIRCCAKCAKTRYLSYFSLTVDSIFAENEYVCSPVDVKFFIDAYKAALAANVRFVVPIS